MDTYSVFKFLHVAASICWIGGGVTLAVLGLMASSRKDNAAMLGILNSVGILANRWFVPASLVTLVFGIAMATFGGLWEQAWVELGLIGFAVTFVTGHFGLRPFAMRVRAMADAGDIDGAAAEGRRMLNVAKFDYTMLFMIVALMVLKPTWGDIVTLGTIALILVVAAAIFLTAAFRQSEPAGA